MAEGCNLPASKEDIEQIEESLNKGIETDRRKFASSSLKNIYEHNSEGLLKSLSDPKNIGYKPLNQLLKKAFGEGKVTVEEESKLNFALYLILKDHHNPQGLFEKPPVHRGPGSTSVDHPYEILCAAALMQNKFMSSNGHSLTIRKTDRIDLGQKSPSNNILSTTKKNTIESDILISRDKGLIDGYDVIGIDAKYSKNGNYSSTKDLARQLKGIKNSLNDGSLQEFYFATNGKFSSQFKNEIFEVNRCIIKEAIVENREFYKDVRYVTKPENESISAAELAGSIDFEKYKDKINELIKDKLPQIGFCEGVSFS